MGKSKGNKARKTPKPASGAGGSSDTPISTSSSSGPPPKTPLPATPTVLDLLGPQFPVALPSPSPKKTSRPRYPDALGPQSPISPPATSPTSLKTLHPRPLDLSRSIPPTISTAPSSSTPSPATPDIALSPKSLTVPKSLTAKAREVDLVHRALLGTNTDKAGEGNGRDSELEVKPLSFGSKKKSEDVPTHLFLGGKKTKWDEINAMLEGFLPSPSPSISKASEKSYVTALLKSVGGKTLDAFIHPLHLTVATATIDDSNLFDTSITSLDVPPDLSDIEDSEEEFPPRLNTTFVSTPRAPKSKPSAPSQGPKLAPVLAPKGEAEDNSLAFNRLFQRAVPVPERHGPIEPFQRAQNIGGNAPAPDQPGVRQFDRERVEEEVEEINRRQAVEKKAKERKKEEKSGKSESGSRSTVRMGMRGGGGETPGGDGSGEGSSAEPSPTGSGSGERRLPVPPRAAILPPDAILAFRNYAREHPDSECVQLGKAALDATLAKNSDNKKTMDNLILTNMNNQLDIANTAFMDLQSTLKAENDELRAKKSAGKGSSAADAKKIRELEKKLEDLEGKIEELEGEKGDLIMREKCKELSAQGRRKQEDKIEDLRVQLKSALDTLEEKKNEEKSGSKSSRADEARIHDLEAKLADLQKGGMISEDDCDAKLKNQQDKIDDLQLQLQGAIDEARDARNTLDDGDPPTTPPGQSLRQRIAELGRTAKECQDEVGKNGGELAKRGIFTDDQELVRLQTENAGIYNTIEELQQQHAGSESTLRGRIFQLEDNVELISGERDYANVRITGLETTVMIANGMLRDHGHAAIRDQDDSGNILNQDRQFNTLRSLLLRTDRSLAEMVQLRALNGATENDFRKAMADSDEAVASAERLRNALNAIEVPEEPLNDGAEDAVEHEDFAARIERIGVVAERQKIRAEIISIEDGKRRVPGLLGEALFNSALSHYYGNDGVTGQRILEQAHELIDDIVSEGTAVAPDANESESDEPGPNAPESIKENIRKWMQRRMDSGAVDPLWQAYDQGTARQGHTDRGQNSDSKKSAKGKQKARETTPENKVKKGGKRSRRNASSNESSPKQSSQKRAKTSKPSEATGAKKRGLTAAPAGPSNDTEMTNAPADGEGTQS